MTVADIHMGYGIKVTDEQLAALNGALIYGDKFELDDGGMLKSWHKHLVLLEAMPQDLEFTVSKIVSHPAFDKLAHPRNPRFNQKVRVVVPGNGLLNIREVVVHESMCTEELQRRLNDGWCIVAVCPQPDQRRPDYVLGRVAAQ